MNATLDLVGIDSLARLKSTLESIPSPESETALRELVERLHVPRTQWQKWVRFDPEQFCVQPIHESDQFEVNCIGWKSGQRSSIHDHGRSSCCVLVLDGVLTNVDFERRPSGALQCIGTSVFHPGEILTRRGNQIHQCGNDQPRGRNLVTLHVYSPPLAPLEERQQA